MVNSLYSWWYRHGIISLIVFTVVLLTFGPLYRADYAITDDYGFLLTGSGSGDVYLADGRPVYYLAQEYIHSQVTSLHQLAYLRFLGVMFTAVLAVVFYQLVKHIGGSRLERSAFAVAMVTLPCLHDPIAMALLWLSPVASLCACLAAILTRRIISQKFVDRVPYWKLIIPLSLMLICGMIYQPMLAFYWTVVLLFVLDPRFLRSPTYRREIAVVVAFGFICFICCFVAMKVCFLATGTMAKERTALMNNPLEKIYWFLRIQLPLALNYWQLTISGSRLLPLATAAITGGMITLGYLLFSSRHLQKLRNSASPARESRWLMIGHALLIVCLVALSHVHWFAIKDLTQSYRIIAPLGASAWILMYWALRQISTRFIARPSRHNFRRTGMAAVAIFAIFICQKHSEDLYANSYSLAYRYVVYCLRDGISENHKAIHMIIQGREDGLVEEYYIESFGRPLSEAYWTITDCLLVALREVDHPHSIQTITYGDSDDPPPQDEETLVIDMRKLKLFRMGEGRSRD